MFAHASHGVGEIDESCMDEYACACLRSVPVAMARELLRRPCGGPHPPSHRQGWQAWLSTRYGADRLEGTVHSSAHTNGDTGAKPTSADITAYSSSTPAVLRQMDMRLGWLLDSSAYDVMLVVACSNTETVAEESSCPAASVSIFAHKAILSATSGKLAAMIRFETVDVASSSSSSTSTISSQRQNNLPISEPLVLRLDAVGGLSESDVRELLWQAYTGTLPPASAPPSVLLSAPVSPRNSDGGCSRTYEAAAVDDGEQEDDQDEEGEVEVDHLLRLLWVADEFLAARWTLSLVRRLFRQLALAPQCAGSVFMASKVLCNATLCKGQVGDGDVISVINNEMDVLVKVAALICVLTCSSREDNNEDRDKDEQELIVDALQSLTD